MTHDPEVYDSPDAFIPERYNNSDAEMKKVYDVVFGFGRRSCPGMQFGEGTIFMTIVTALATLNVSAEVDEKGNPVLPEMIWSDGVIR